MIALHGEEILFTVRIFFICSESERIHRWVNWKMPDNVCQQFVRLRAVKLGTVRGIVREELKQPNVSSFTRESILKLRISTGLFKKTRKIFM